jgi:hypothetical protein
MKQLKFEPQVKLTLKKILAAVTVLLFAFQKMAKYESKAKFLICGYFPQILADLLLFKGKVETI